MNNEDFIYLAYQKDFSEQGNSRYFLYHNGFFSESTSLEVSTISKPLVTHDFWLISESIFKEHKTLPSNVIDVVLLAKIIEGTKASKDETQPWDITNTIRHLYNNERDFETYLEMFYRRAPLSKDTYMLFSHKLAEYSDRLFLKASMLGEKNRFIELEAPLYNALVLSASTGIPVSKEKIKSYKSSLKLDYYRGLKKFAETHNVLYEVPSDGDIKEKLDSLGYDTEDFSIDFLIDFLPSIDGYTEDLKSLRKLSKSYRVFNSISSETSRLKPIVESHWTSTGRIYHKSPNTQNISKSYRDIFIPDTNFSLCYVDYDQFEVGIMAALSQDKKMKHIYETTDAYLDFSTRVFNSPDKRKISKILFLSYTYGMSMENIKASVYQNNGNEMKAEEYFSEFNRYEEWKLSLLESFLKLGKISTINANYLNRSQGGELSEKEKRSAVNHVIQGSATYIFKKALLELSKEEGVQILIPMHDAVLFQHNSSFSPEKSVQIFEKTMTDLLEERVKGKASIEPFYHHPS